MGETLMVRLLIPVAFGFSLSPYPILGSEGKAIGTRLDADIVIARHRSVSGFCWHQYCDDLIVKYRYRDASRVEHGATRDVPLEDPSLTIVVGKALIAYDADHPDRTAWIGR